MITFIGGPASGKSTRMELLEGFDIISSAKLLLDAGYDLSTGEYVSDDVVAELIMKQINSTDTNIILDGFPRTINQYKALEKNNVVLSKVYYIDTPDSVMLERANDRLTCINCHASYTKSNFKKPIIHGICDKCSSQLVNRPDDSLDLMLKRINIYKERTLPLLNYFIDSGVNVIRVDGMAPLSEFVNKKVKVLIKK